MYFPKLINCTTNKKILNPPDFSKNHCLGFNYYRLVNAFNDFLFRQIKIEWIKNKANGTIAKFSIERIYPSIPPVLGIIPQ
jgi:hypothetical protein